MRWVKQEQVEARPARHLLGQATLQGQALQAGEGRGGR